MQDFDHLWRRLKDNYAYFDKKETNRCDVKNRQRSSQELGAESLDGRES